MNNGCKREFEFIYLKYFFSLFVHLEKIEGCMI